MRELTDKLRLNYGNIEKGGSYNDYRKNCNQVVNYLKDMGVREDYKVIIGGAETNQKVADEMGADG